VAVIEAIYLVAAMLWIVVVLAAVAIGGRYLLKLRARRRRVNRLINSVRLPVGRAVGPYRAAAVRSAALLLRVAVDVREAANPDRPGGRRARPPMLTR